MPESTFILRFTHYDSSEIEEQEHTTAESAWAAFRTFAEPGSFETYSRVELVEYYWAERQEYPRGEHPVLPLGRHAAGRGAPSGVHPLGR